jgi:hypothetical protein
MSGNSASSDRIAGSNASTADPLGGRRYLGGLPDANAFATVFLEIPNRLAIPACDSPSDTCSRRISAQSSTLITPKPSYSGVLNLHPSTTAQSSRVGDTRARSG